MYHNPTRKTARYALGDDYRFPGLSAHTVEWFHERDVAAAFTDNYAYESFPPLSPDDDPAPLSL